MYYREADGQPARCPARPKPRGVIAPPTSELGQSRHLDRGPVPSGLPRSNDIVRPPVDQPVDRVRGERRTALNREYIAAVRVGLAQRRGVDPMPMSTKTFEPGDRIRTPHGVAWV